MTVATIATLVIAASALGACSSSKDEAGEAATMTVPGATAPSPDSSVPEGSTTPPASGSTVSVPGIGCANFIQASQQNDEALDTDAHETADTGLDLAWYAPTANADEVGVVYTAGSKCQAFTNGDGGVTFWVFPASAQSSFPANASGIESGWDYAGPALRVQRENFVDEDCSGTSAIVGLQVDKAFADAYGCEYDPESSVSTYEREGVWRFADDGNFGAGILVLDHKPSGPGDFAGQHFTVTCQPGESDGEDEEQGDEPPALCAAAIDDFLARHQGKTFAG